MLLIRKKKKVFKVKRNLTSEGLEFEKNDCDVKLAYEMERKYFKFDARSLQSPL